MYKHILVPIALDHEHTPNEALAVANRLLSEGGRITAMHVMEPVPGFAAQYLPEHHADTQVANLERRMHEALVGADVSVAVVTGSAGRAICDFAADHQADLIIVASHRPELSDYFLGSTAARVVRHARCAVHVLR